MENNVHFAEIIESSLHEWKAQCWEWNKFPTFGSLVTIKTSQRTIFGIVHQIQMGSMDPNRHPFPYKKTEKELMQEQPQIFEFLKTTFSCITLGYKQQGKIFYLLSPNPPKIHAFVSQADTEESREFFAGEKYLHLLFGLSGQVFNIEELLLAMINQQIKLNVFSEGKITKFIDTFNLLTGNDYRKLKLFLQRMEPLLRNKTPKGQIHV